MIAEPHTDTSAAEPTKAGVKKPIDPSIILLFVVLLAVAMTYVLDSGRFERKGVLVIPGSYKVLGKDSSASNLFNLDERPDKEATTTAVSPARPVSLVEAVMAIPEGLNKRAGLIFMVLFIGGMFGVLNKAGAIDAGLERLLGLTRGNIYILVPILMLVFSAGSTFMGLAKEYILIVPLMVAMANRLNLPNLIGLAIVAIPVKVGYLASVTNPLVLSVAQPLVGLPVFSGIWLRLVTYVLFLAVSIAFVIFTAHRYGFNRATIVQFETPKLSQRHGLTLLALCVGVSFMIFASLRWHWNSEQMSAYYFAMSIGFAMLAGLTPSVAATSFVGGMNKVLIAGVLIGLASAVEIVLSKGEVLDTIVNGLANAIGHHGPLVSAIGLFFASLGIDVFIPSTSGQAAVTMPIFGPIGQLSGVSPQTTVFAFLLGHGLTNFITPTSSGLLVLLATAQVGWVQWAKFILPLFGILLLLALVMLTVAVGVSY